ncbi:O-linked N-acetylglucosamine transferase, SPINDLY family protein [Geminocystis sp. GBBB08]|uniref:O-linked N-acetylglucosamine transferase, SPINDLY family protein n=1 Tax=Geminocystis sp. GBBB08 TaxID=2604140 RepID=UPI0027E22BE1|nr:O-linked N-acetylglucosamine transferase, SPINDLY family protein [Geminocystis sp. GBBB08]MBL1210918.1 O-linked N-acetylglucosamine transferase, SPINDLY family protein [Geminocystis sp. GBBB08]
MNWHPDTIEFLAIQNYDHIINFYEHKIENNPDEINNYWYLGLAHLLNNNEELAQSIWLIPFLEMNLDYSLQESLIQVLDQEADRQKQKNNFLKSALIREQVQEIDNNNLANLINLCLLKHHLNSFAIEFIEETNLGKIIVQKSLSNIEIKLIIALCNIILEIPHQITLDFVTAVYPQMTVNKEFSDLLTSKIEVMADEKRFLMYGAKLLEITLLNQPNNLEIIRQIFIYYSQARNYDNAKLIALEYQKYSTTLIEKVFASYQLLYNAIESSDWLNIKDYHFTYENILNDLVKQQPNIQEKYLANWLISIGQLLLYLQDNPTKNKKFINGIGQLFQKQGNSYYSCPVHFVAPNQLAISKKLKIGYIGHTLRSHSVGLLSRWLIHHHDKEQFSIYTYFACQKDDYITQRFFKDNVHKAYSGTNIVNDFITRIEQDQIDILVDLDSFTHNLTAMIMALKPAPIQVSWLGMDSNGIPNIDYFIADPYVLPKNAQEYYSETIWRLPNTYLGIDGFEVDIPTLTRKDLEIDDKAIVYFNVQSAFKRNPHTIHLQMKILKTTPNSYLLIKGVGDDSTTQNLFKTIAQEEGVNIDKLRFLPQTPTEAIHRANLAIADVVLDTYPYNGATTTLETLWMEIPLVTRVGEQFAARNSYTFMINAGITEGIAWNDDEYIEWGVKLGTNENLRQEISWKLRQSKKTSPLWKGKQFAREMEKAYQQMWQIYSHRQ